MTARQNLKEWMKKTIGQERSWHYAMTRPIPIARIKAGLLPISTDCSGGVVGGYAAAGMEDPSGNDFNGAGWTGSLLTNGDRISKSALAVGDGVIYADGAGDTHHVAMVYEIVGSVIWLWSHGQEAGPIRISLDAENTFHGSLGRHPIYVRWMDGDDIKPKRYRWIVKNGAGTVLARTIHPVVWASGHPRAFRKYGNIVFLRRNRT